MNGCGSSTFTAKHVYSVRVATSEVCLCRARNCGDTVMEIMQHVLVMADACGLHGLR
jgi:hypothetical protein